MVRGLLDVARKDDHQAGRAHGHRCHPAQAGVDLFARITRDGSATQIKLRLRRSHKSVDPCPRRYSAKQFAFRVTRFGFSRSDKSTGGSGHAGPDGRAGRAWPPPGSASCTRVATRVPARNRRESAPGESGRATARGSRDRSTPAGAAHGSSFRYPQQRGAREVRAAPAYASQPEPGPLWTVQAYQCGDVCVDEDTVVHANPPRDDVERGGRYRLQTQGARPPHRADFRMFDSSNQPKCAPWKYGQIALVRDATKRNTGAP